MIIDKNDLIGYWSSPNIELGLEPRAVVNLLWPVNQKATHGTWEIQGTQLKILYNTNSAHSTKFEFGLQKSRYEHTLVYELKRNSKDCITLTDESFQQFQLFLHREKTSMILQRAQARENLFQALGLTIFITILLGGLIRWLITPEIPTWLIVLAIFIGSFVFIKRSN